MTDSSYVLTSRGVISGSELLIDIEDFYPSFVPTVIPFHDVFMDLRG